MTRKNTSGATYYRGSQTAAYQSDTALLVIDSQHAYCNPKAQHHWPEPGMVAEERVERALDRIAVARHFADKYDIPTFLIYSIFANTPNDPSTPFHSDNFGLYRQRLSGLFELAVKSDASAFKTGNRFGDEPKVESQLPELLHHSYPKVKTLILTGFNTSVCLQATAEDALNLKFQVAVLSDCTANCERNFEEDEIRALAALKEQGAWVGTLRQFKKYREQQRSAPKSNP